MKMKKEGAFPSETAAAAASARTRAEVDAIPPNTAAGAAQTIRADANDFSGLLLEELGERVDALFYLGALGSLLLNSLPQ